MRESSAIGAECRLLLVRHATAQGNGRFQGQRNVPLAETGRLELPLLVKKCSMYPVRVIYSSDLRRASKTAEAIARQFGLEVKIRSALREMSFGLWEGLSWKQVRSRFPRTARLWIERFPQHAIPGAESFGSFKRRVVQEVRGIVRTNPGRCVVIVSHAGVIRVALARALGLPDRNLFRLEQRSCAVNVIDAFNDGAIVRLMNA
ncbi:MAG TPA: histidine phosphatase family protein [Terriglobia bacterium]|nr:histidine phosphatase family protein [Terriglobia bacterium]